MEDAMTHEEEEIEMLDELMANSADWFIERPEKLDRLMNWKLSFPRHRLRDDVSIKYYNVLRAAGFSNCHYCFRWRKKSDLVWVDATNWYPSSRKWHCCKGTCEISLLMSR